MAGSQGPHAASGRRSLCRRHDRLVIRRGICRNRDSFRGNWVERGDAIPSNWQTCAEAAVDRPLEPCPHQHQNCLRHVTKHTRKQGRTGGPRDVGSSSIRRRRRLRSGMRPCRKLESAPHCLAYLLMAASPYVGQHAHARADTRTHAPAGGDYAAQ